MDEKVGFHESGMWLPIKIGKLDIPATLAEASNTLKGQSVGVYVAGGPLCLNKCMTKAPGCNLLASTFAA